MGLWLECANIKLRGEDHAFNSGWRDESR